MAEKYSFSKLNTYDSCPYNFKLRYVDKHFVSEPSLAAQYGTLVHLIYQRIAESIMRGEEIPYEELKDTFVNINLPKRNHFDREGDIFGTKVLSQQFAAEWNDLNSKSGKSYRVKAVEFLDTGIYRLEDFMKENPELEIVGTEVSFEYIYRKYCFYGFIDRLLRVKETNRYIIHDIKTKDHPFSDSELTTPLQFYVYTQALRDKYGKDIEIECYYDLPTIGMLQKAGTKGFENRAKKKIDKILDAVEAEEFPPRPSPLCWWCSFRAKDNQPEEAKGLCPYYSLWTPENKVYDVKNTWEGEESHQKIMSRFKDQQEEDEIRNPKKHGRKFDFEF